jgi:hypothetical protein
VAGCKCFSPTAVARTDGGHGRIRKDGYGFGKFFGDVAWRQNSPTKGLHDRPLEGSRVQIRFKGSNKVQGFKGSRVQIRFKGSRVQIRFKSSRVQTLQAVEDAVGDGVFGE